MCACACACVCVCVFQVALLPGTMFLCSFPDTQHVQPAPRNDTVAARPSPGVKEWGNGRKRWEEPSKCVFSGERERREERERRGERERERRGERRGEKKGGGGERERFFLGRMIFRMAGNEGRL